MRILISATILTAIISFPVEAAFHWGVNGHPNVQEGYREIPIAQQLDLVKSLGAGWYRTDWSEIAMRKDIAPFDYLVNEARRRGIRLLPIIFPENGCRSDKSPEEIRKSSSEFAAWVAKRYRNKITHWELSNELDAYAMIRKGETDRNGKVWESGDADMDRPEHFNEDRYAKVSAELSGLAEGIKLGNRLAKTIINSSGWLHYAFFQRLIEEDKVEFDIIGWHWYSEMGDMTKVKGSLNVLEILKKYNKPIWITEINARGGSINGESAMTEYLTSTAKQMRSYPGVDAFFVYELFDEPYFGPDNPESHFGLVKIVKDSNNLWSISDKKETFDRMREIMKKK